MRNLEQIKAFLFEKLNKFVKEFPNTKVSYVIDDSSSVFVEILPNSVYHSDEKYIEWENRITDEFLDTFPYLNFAFITDDAFVKFEKWDNVIEGKSYNISAFNVKEDNQFVNDIFTVESFNINNNTSFTIKNTSVNLMDKFVENGKNLLNSKTLYTGMVDDYSKLVASAGEFSLAA